MSEQSEDIFHHWHPKHYAINGINQMIDVIIYHDPKVILEIIKEENLDTIKSNVKK